MTTKTVTIRAIDLMPGLGNDKDGIPFRHLSALVEKVRSIVPDDEEASCMVHGAAGLTFAYQHKLTEVERLAEELADYKAKAEGARLLLLPDGSLVPDAAERLRELLG